MKHQLNTFLLTILFACNACAAKKDDWSNIDYSSVYRAAEQREIDARYRQPSVVGCVNDDLYLCR